MITGKQEELKQLAEANKCPLHKDDLVVAWHAGENSYVIRCGAGHYPEEMEALLSRTRQFKQDTLAKVDPSFNLLSNKDLGTGEFLDTDKLAGLIKYAERYGLDAYRGHVVVMYGQPYIGIDGYLYHANQEKESYKLISKPLTKEERTQYMIVNEKDHAWIATVEKANDSVFTGLGIVTEEEMTARSKWDTNKLASPVVAAHPWQLAQKRAEWQALRRGFPIGEADNKEEG